MDIQAYLKENDLTMERFGQLVKVNQPAISLIVNKKRRPSPELALRIEEATDGKVSKIELLYPDTATTKG